MRLPPLGPVDPPASKVGTADPAPPMRATPIADVLGPPPPPPQFATATGTQVTVGAQPGRQGQRPATPEELELARRLGQPVMYRAVSSNAGPATPAMAAVAPAALNAGGAGSGASGGQLASL